MKSDPIGNPQGIAVIGLACRFPGAKSADELWRNLRAGKESITFFSEGELLAAGVDPALLKDPQYVPAKGVLEQADAFDAAFFGISSRDAALMDPQQRVFLETAWTALEDAGYDAQRAPGSIGLFAGSILSMYLLRNLGPNREAMAAGTFQVAVGNDPTFLATSTSYHLDLRGPSVSVGTACSTSLVAVHLACLSLLASECDMALAGGVSIHLPLVGGYRYEEGGILSPDGHCRAFDAGARGTVSSDGVGVVVLKRLEDALADGDDIRAVILGSAINNDGRRKVGFTAPGERGEAQAIAEAIAMAGIDPRTLSMIEAHGAGTPLGDPIELAALNKAFEGVTGRGFCALGSVKCNIGHVDAAAGIAGLIKTVLALEHREIPPTLHFERINPQMPLEATPFYVPRALTPVTGDGPMRAGVSSFGIGGTNAHVVLEEAPGRARTGEPDPGRPYQLLVLSAATPTALEAATDQLAEHLAEPDPGDLEDIAFTLSQGRKTLRHRRVVVCQNRDEAIQALRTRDSRKVATAAAPPSRPVVTFMFPGLGDHYPGMGWELYCTETVFRETVDRCAGLLASRLGEDLRDVLYPGRTWTRPVLDPPRIDASSGRSGFDLRAMLGKERSGGASKERSLEPSVDKSLDKASDKPAEPPRDRDVALQVAIFVTEYALAQLIRGWGIEPSAMIGHSTGEFVAACLSGVFSLEDALEVVATRARLIRTRVMPGAMLAVPLEEDALRPLLPEGVSLGAVNAARLCVASGDISGVDALSRELAARGIDCRRLRSTHAYHSRMMEAIVDPLTDLMRRVTLRAPRIPYVSCITGAWITAAEATDPAYWARHLCRTVRFQTGLSLLLEDPERVLLEVGPGQGLTSHAIAERARGAGQSLSPQAIAERTRGPGQGLTSHAIAERARGAGRENPIIPTMRWSYGLDSELAVLLLGMGRLWMAGASTAPARFLPPRSRRRVRLPTYPFERQRYWIDAPSEDTVPSQGGLLRKKPDIADWFYAPCWKPSSQRKAPESDAGRNWLIFNDPLGLGKALAAALRARGDHVVTVEAGEALSSNPDRFVINPRRREHYEAVFQALQEGGRSPHIVAHLWSLTAYSDGAPSSQRFTALQDTGYHSLISLIQAICGMGLEGAVRLEVVSNHLLEVRGDERLAPEKATLLAPVMVAPQEHPGFRCRYIDLDISSDDPARHRSILPLLLNELSSAPDDPMVAYRRGLRWLPAYEPLRLELTAPGHGPFRHRGVYLLTGGLGGVGLVLARHLAETVQARLVLLGRSPLPSRSEWAKWKAEHDETDRTRSRIQQIEALEALGAEVLVLSADVSSHDEMAEAVAAIEERFGALHGVIHGAGAIGLETFREIREATAADAGKQFVPKVEGTLVLEQVLEGLTLDFCLLVSSLSAVLGGLGFSAYSAANLFMDAYARWKNRQGGVRWTAIDWDSWKVPGIRPTIAGLGQTVGAFVMEPEQACAALERVLAEVNLEHVVVSTGDLQARRRLWIDRRGQADSAPPVTARHARPHLRTDYQAPRGELEQTLAEIWQELFGLERVGVHDNFFELGGHSLLATQLSARLSARLHVQLSLATLLRAPTITELALAVVSHRAATTDAGALEAILAELGIAVEQE